VQEKTLVKAWSHLNSKKLLLFRYKFYHSKPFLIHTCAYSMRAVENIIQNHKLQRHACEITLPHIISIFYISLTHGMLQINFKLWSWLAPKLCKHLPSDEYSWSNKDKFYTQKRMAWLAVHQVYVYELVTYFEPSLYAFVTGRAGLKGRRARGNFYWRVPRTLIHDITVCKSYVFADSQGIRLFFPVVEYVLIQITYS